MQSLFNVEAKNKTKPEMVKDQIWPSSEGWQMNVNETEGDTWFGLKRTMNKTKKWETAARATCWMHK